ncbi:type II secretion system secretin GspD [Pseudovibrio sp. Tun.PSC04-5.I4]|uniref:type II secretion system secretin GspD n=1 Tax=Pseudovibrio sp. Tun.PSC04-5.I4 TaxID=1798213 RepID=UPI0008906843|nr:type II secretion system secretin GspD [Pseudovibrio sp. Tun.PSC04-5.I4]SDR14942.1 type II secretion system protein D (GspD) [Pseudovibrio sp. Tun.PSC04-5.I4]
MIGAGLSSILRKTVCSFAVFFGLLGCTATQHPNLEWEAPANQAGLSEQLRYFFSEENQRELVPTLSGNARLATTSRGLPGQAIDSRWVNRGNSQEGRPGTAFYFNDEEAKVLLADAALNTSNTQELRTARSQDAKTTSDVVNLNFRGEALDYFTRQTLGGILQVNYVIDEPLQGTVTFQTEKPIAKDQMLSLVRVLLGRNGYILKLIDQIFHIGRPETIQAIEQFSGVGSAGDLKLRILPVRSASADDAAGVLQAILPAGASAIAVEGTNKVAVRARPEDIVAAEELVNSLYNRNNDKTVVSVLRLQQSSASQVAKQLTTLFRQLYPNQLNASLTVVPLEAQQSLLVAVQSKEMLLRVRRIVKEVDYNLLDSPKVRIISLKYLPASEIAGQLTQILQGGGSSGGAQEPKADRKPKQRKPGRAPRRFPVSANGEPVDNNSDINDRFNAADNLFEGAKETGARSVPAGKQIGIVADSRNNALLVNSTYQEFKHIRDVVQALDLPLSQVVIEATIAEVSINDSLSYGVQWYLSKGIFSGGTGQVASGVTRPSSPGGAIALNTVGVDVVLKALQNITKVKVISSPYLTVLDGRKARLVIGDQVPFASRSQTSSDSGTVTVTNEVEVKDTGIVLQVEPNIRPNNSVLLQIQQEVSNVISTKEGPSLTPTISTRTINSDIVVESGRTILLGGLIQERKEEGESGVPILRKIPVFGELFKDSTNNESKRTELLVMITPRVVRKQSELQNITQKLRRELSSF